MSSSRRSFLKQTSAGLLTSALAQDPPPEFRIQPVELVPVDPLAEGVTRPWLGPAYWANRLQDWRLRNGRIECMAGGSGDEVRTVALVTRELVRGSAAAHLSYRSGVIEAGQRGGFCGFLIGAGAGQLDWRAAALVQKASGTGGGFLCTWDTDGGVRFREHTDEDRPLGYAALAAETTGSARPDLGPEYTLRLDVVPQAQNRFDVKLSVWDSSGQTFLAGAVRRGVAESELLGGVALVSSPATAVTGARFWFADVRTSGAKLAQHPDRAIGPILGTLHSLNGNVLKLSAQLMPVGEEEPQSVQFQYRAPSSRDWNDGPTANLGPGYCAVFRMDRWDATLDWEYRVVYGKHAYEGIIRRDPAQKDSLRIGLFSCTIASARSLEAGSGRTEIPQAESLGRYTHKNIYFPHRELVRNASRHQADLLVFCGDQLYEGNPTRRDTSPAPTLDYLYKWYLWVLSFREMTRDTPAIVMTDDHDVYHGNLWGNGGRLAPERDQNRGGYRCTGDFVNVVTHTQAGHNPDAFDPTPVDQGIAVYYGAFRYGGVSFAVLEDRKFKTAPLQGADLDVHEAELLGERQEKFLKQWAREKVGATAKVCLTQSLFACVQTSPARKPLLDFDSNGYPKLARDRAIRLLREARALVLAGDQHLGTLVRHGVDTFTDGVYQFTGPAVGSSWQRWWEPPELVKDWTDAFGNKVRVLAVANPKISFAEYRKHIKGRGQGLGDRRLKSEGYGIVRVNRKSQDVVIECWPWNVDPTAAAGEQQFDGWPVRLKLSEL